MRRVAGGWFFSFTRVACCSFGKSQNFSYSYLGRVQKEAKEMRNGELEADKDRMMREYRAQLDAERAIKLSHGRNHSSRKSGQRKDKKEKDSKKRSSKMRKRSRKSSDSSSSSSSESSSSDDENRESRGSKSWSKRRKREKKHRSRSKQSGSDNKVADGPLPLSRFFGNMKN